MDGQRFDDLTRRLLAATTRRRVLAAAAGLLGSAEIAGDASAGRPRAGRCRPDHVGCTRDSQCCGSVCVTDRSLPRSRRNRCCTPVCDGKVCGDDGCGGTCGCDAGASCNSGICSLDLSCATYDGEYDPGFSACVTLVEGGSSLSRCVVGLTYRACTETADCSDLGTGPGQSAVCATHRTICDDADTCYGYGAFGFPMCVWTSSAACED